MPIKGIWETVYFLRQGKFIKIGHTTTEVRRRIKNYMTHSLEDTVLLGFTYGDRAMEREYHRMFSEYQVKGEWFRHEGRLVEFISEVLPKLQARTEQSRVDEMRREMQEVPRILPREPEPAPIKKGRKLVSRDGKIFNTKGKRVLAVKAGDYFVDA
jgi:hypothetical protein